MRFDDIDTKKIVLAISSGLLLTASFPKIGFHWMAWFALIPLYVSIRALSPQKSFKLGFLAGMIHYLTLLYWLVHTMEIYGRLPLYLSLAILLLFSAYLSIYMALFSAAAVRSEKKPFVGLALTPLLWVSLEYLRSFFLSGFPWELIGYSQYNQLTLIQIADIFGVYGVSFVVALTNTILFIGLLYLTRKTWQGKIISNRQAAAAMVAGSIFLGCLWFYGNWRINSIDRLISNAGIIKSAVIQGNIDQDKKWDPVFQKETIKTYIQLSLMTKRDKPDLVVWPETATPFYFLHDTQLSEMVKTGIQLTGTSFLIGSPSFMLSHNNIHYYNSAYLVEPNGEVTGKYDKVHLVPFGEYVPFKRWLPFLGKIVAHVGDFQSGIRGNVIHWEEQRLGIQICFEIIFPMLSRALVKNKADLLVNITNDAWFGKTSAPYQHFTMGVFRAIENRRALVRSANTGISGFIDPVGRIIATTPLCETAVMIQNVPLLKEMTFYTRFGNFFAITCLIFALLYLTGFKW